MSAYVFQGDSCEVLATLPESSVHCCVTSPPYFGLRDYGHEGQIGLEDTPDAFVAQLVDVFREVRRVLRDDGTLWLNLGDSYASTGTTRWPNTGDGFGNGYGKHGAWHGGEKVRPQAPGLKPKNLIGIPWRVAFALQSDGWYLRQDIIWHKPNPMPESVRDRCTKAHEYVFLLSKSERYYFDSGAIQEPAAASSIARWNQNIEAQRGSDRVPGKTNGPMKAVGGRRRKQNSTNESFVPGATSHGGLHREGSEHEPEMRNRRSVWTIPTRPYKGAHFATFPPALIEPCILAGAPLGGVVLDPFNGSGTTGAVALKHGRRYVGVEINPSYIALTHKRLFGDLA